MTLTFQKTLNTIRTAWNGKTILDKGKSLGQNSKNKIVAPIAVVQTKHDFHATTKQDYPQADYLPLPMNIDPTESTRFSPQRARDITSTAIASNIWNHIDITMDGSIAAPSSMPDPHIGSYDCTGAISLSSSMQSNVPSPFGGMNSFTHLSMPGGQWEQGSKWMSHDLQSSHYTHLRRQTRKDWSKSNELGIVASPKQTDIKGTFLANRSLMHGRMPLLPSKTFVRSYHLNAHNAFCISSVFVLNANANRIMHLRCYSTSNKSETSPNSNDKINASATKSSATESQGSDGNAAGPAATPVAVSKKDQFKKAIKEYGSTVLAFHVGISLLSLGFFYQLVASGLDVVALLDKIGMTNSMVSTNIATGASTFVIAYAVHKLFAPVRISITLVSAPLIVRYLRKKGILKAPKNHK